MTCKLIKLICPANLYLFDGILATSTSLKLLYISKYYEKVSEMNPFQKTYAMENSRLFWKF